MDDLRNKLLAIEEAVRELGNSIEEITISTDPLYEAGYCKITTQRLGRHVADMEKVLDTLISQMETIESLKGKEDDKR